MAIDTFDLILPNVPRSEAHILNPSGHYCYREQPRAFLDAVLCFLAAG